MRRARTVAELFADTEEPRCYLRDRFLFWALDRDLGGQAVWGNPGVRDARIDDYAVVVRPGGIVGATVACFLDVVDATNDYTVVASVADACEHLGRLDAAERIGEIYAQRDAQTADHALADRLQALLMGPDPPAGLPAAAKRLAMSPRTLQHRLKATGTTYRKQHHRARLERARQLLRAGGKLAVIAIEVGFSSSQHFAAWFKRETGTTPSQWRRRDGEAPSTPDP